MKESSCHLINVIRWRLTLDGETPGKVCVRMVGEDD